VVTSMGAEDDDCNDDDCDDCDGAMTRPGTR
jgi:hypothetical protein